MGVRRACNRVCVTTAQPQIEPSSLPKGKAMLSFVLGLFGWRRYRWLTLDAQGRITGGYKYLRKK